MVITASNCYFHYFFRGGRDQIIWQYETNGIYSSSSMYTLVNFRGEQPIYLPPVWKLKILPRIQVFLWLFSQNKIMTTDNLRARGMAKPLECEMCNEIELSSILCLSV
jgi:hypothetical protein